MDPLTKNLLSRLGRTPGLPKLPPVNNVRLLNLQKGLQPAELALHNARIALDNFQKAPSATLTVQQARTNLHLAMAALQGREQDYFANTYTGTDKRMVLDGWTDWKQRQLRLQVLRLQTEGNAHMNAVVANPQLNNRAEESATAAAQAARAVQRANNLWYNRGVRETTRPAGLHNEGDIIHTSLQTIRDNLFQLENERPPPQHADANIASAKLSLTKAQLSERLFKVVVAGKWVSTDETRP